MGYIYRSHYPYRPGLKEVKYFYTGNLRVDLIMIEGACEYELPSQGAGCLDHAIHLIYIGMI